MNLFTWLRYKRGKAILGADYYEDGMTVEDYAIHWADYKVEDQVQKRNYEFWIYIKHMMKIDPQRRLWLDSFGLYGWF